MAKRGERVAEIGRHRCEDRALDMAVTVEKGVDLAEPAERVR